MKYKLCEGITMEKVDECNVLVADNGDAAVLNDVGSEIVTLLEKGMQPNDIVDAISNMYDTDNIDVKEDIDDFLEELKAKALIEAC